MNVMMSLWVIILIIYILSPFDLIPEAVFSLIGFIDDILILGVLILYISNIYYNHLREIELNRNR